MVDRIIPSTETQVGIPSQWEENWPDDSNPLLTGHEPAILQTDEIFPANIDWPAYTPVAFDTDGVTLKKAVAGTDKAIGITIIREVRAAGVTGKKGPIYRAGCLNPAKLAWDASYDSVAKKNRAFEGAPTPTNVVIRPVQGYRESAADRPFAP